jgi:hypothetical protein
MGVDYPYYKKNSNNYFFSKVHFYMKIYSPIPPKLAPKSIPVSHIKKLYKKIKKGAFANF